MMFAASCLIRSQNRYGYVERVKDLKGTAKNVTKSKTADVGQTGEETQGN